MNWDDLGRTLLGLGLPTLGGALIGPAGALAGKALANALGAPATPEGLSKAISTDPEVQKKLADVEIEWARTAATVAQANAQQAQSINATAQAELAAGVSFWHWRHLNGYTVQVYALTILVGFGTAMWTGKPTIADYVTLLGAISGIFLALCALNGYVASDTTRRTTAAAGVPVGGLVDIIGSLFKRK